MISGCEHKIQRFPININISFDLSKPTFVHIFHLNNVIIELFYFQGDEKLDYNAEMYHYHQTKSQLAAMEK